MPYCPCTATTTFPAGATAPPAPPPARFASWRRGGAHRAACGSSLPRMRPARPGGNRTIDPLCSSTTTTACGDIAAQRRRGAGRRLRRAAAGRAALHRRRRPASERAGYAKIADIFFQTIQSQLRSAVACGPPSPRLRGTGSAVVISRAPHPRLRRARRGARRVAVGQRRRDRHAARTERRRQDDDDADAGGVDPADRRPHFDRWRRALRGDRRPCARQLSDC